MSISAKLRVSTCHDMKFLKLFHTEAESGFSAITNVDGSSVITNVDGKACRLRMAELLRE